MIGRAALCTLQQVFASMVYGCKRKSNDMMDLLWSSQCDEETPQVPSSS